MEQGGWGFPGPSAPPGPASPVPPARPDWRVRLFVGLGGFAVGLVLAGLGVAVAQSTGTTPGSGATPGVTVPSLPIPSITTPGSGAAPTTPASPAPAAPAPTPPSPGEKGPGFGGFGGFGRHGFGEHFGKGFGHGFGKGAIHGEFTMPAPAGGYQTVATQIGTVTAVSQSSITVKSDDGFSRTYKVDENTLVNAGRDGIGSVKNGDTVRLTAVGAGNDAKATNIIDSTNVQKSYDKWWPGRR
jgi:hypothetical protein